MSGKPNLIRRGLLEKLRSLVIKNGTWTEYLPDSSWTNIVFHGINQFEMLIVDINGITTFIFRTSMDNKNIDLEVCREILSLVQDNNVEKLRSIAFNLVQDFLCAANIEYPENTHWENIELRFNIYE